MSESDSLQEAARSKQCNLPPMMKNENADFWLTEEEVKEICKLTRRNRLTGWIFGVIVILLWWFVPGTVQPLNSILAYYVMAGLLLPTIGAYIAFTYSNARQLSRARRCSALTRAISRFFVPFGPEVAALGFGQIDAIVGSYEGRFVDSQVCLAESTSNSWLMRPGTIPLLTTGANICARAGRFDLAQPKYEIIVQLAKKPGVKSFSKAIAYHNLGWCCLLTGKPELAKQYLEESARSMKSRLLPIRDSRDARLSSSIDINMARTLIRLGEFDRAERLLQDTFNKVTKRFKHVEGILTETQVGMAELRFCQNRFEEAHMHIESAVEGYRAISGTGTAESRYTRQLKAQILKALGRDVESERLKLECDIEVDVMNTENLARLQQVRAVLTKKLPLLKRP